MSDPDYEPLYERLAEKYKGSSRPDMAKSRMAQTTSMGRRPLKPYCVRGHARTPENVSQSSGGCKLCMKLWNQTHNPLRRERTVAR